MLNNNSKPQVKERENNISNNKYLSNNLFSCMTKHARRPIRRFSSLSVRIFFAKTHPAVQKPRHIPFRLLLVRARKFIIHDPPRVRAASEREGEDRHQPASPIHRRRDACTHACVHASHPLYSSMRACIFIRETER